jgi:hypothetical protein
MEVNNNRYINYNKNYALQKKEQPEQHDKPSYENSGLNNVAVYNKANINFKGYYGDQQPAKKLFWILTGRDKIYKDDETEYKTYHTLSGKKWVTTNPEDLLKRSPEQAIQSICTLNNYYKIPSLILTPNYGDKWGRRANYIEINPRMIALSKGDEKQEGLLSLIKLLPAIPPSSKSYANCVILSQLYPTMDSNDNKTGDKSLYTVNLHSGISKNLTSKHLSRGKEKMGDDEQVKAFNDLAHLRGLKTGIRMPLSEGQMSVHGRPFNWDKDEKAFIDACCWAIDLGFDSIYFDSAKHVGNYDMGNYCGCGRLPNYKQMQYITQQIREKTGRHDISLIGEKCTNDTRFNDMGLSAGTDWSKADDFNSVMHEFRQQRWNDEYASGPIISDDNDDGSLSLDKRLNRIKNAFNGYEDISYRLPTFMQMADLFPISPYTNTHEQMMKSENRTTFGDIESGYNNIFNTSEDAFNYRMKVYQEFANSSGI